MVRRKEGRKERREEGKKEGGKVRLLLVYGLWREGGREGGKNR